MKEDAAPNLSESTIEETLPLGVYEVYLDDKNRVAFPADLRQRKYDFPIWLFYDISIGRAIVIFDQEKFSAEYPEITLTQFHINSQGKITLRVDFLKLQNIPLKPGDSIYFVCKLGRDGKRVIEIYFSDRYFQGFIQSQNALAKKVAEILTTPPSSGSVVLESAYTQLQLTGPGSNIPFCPTGTATLTS